MANRHLLAASRVDEFKAWLTEKEWMVLAPTNYFEAVRARRGKRTIVIYKRLGDHQHLTVKDCDERIVRLFLKERRRK